MEIRWRKRFFFLFFCSAPNLVDPFHTVVVFFPATVEFEESRSLVANTWRTKYFESPRRILVVDRSKNSKKKNSVIFLGLFKQRIEFSIHSKTALNTRKGTEIHWNVIIETDDGRVRSLESNCAIGRPFRENTCALTLFLLFSFFASTNSSYIAYHVGIQFPLCWYFFFRFLLRFYVLKLLLIVRQFGI